MDAAQANGVRETAHLECPICLPVTFLVAPPPTSMFHCVLLTQHGPVLGYARLADVTTWHEARVLPGGTYIPDITVPAAPASGTRRIPSTPVPGSTSTLGQFLAAPAPAAPRCFHSSSFAPPARTFRESSPASRANPRAQYVPAASPPRRSRSPNARANTGAPLTPTGASSVNRGPPYSQVEVAAVLQRRPCHPGGNPREAPVTPTGALVSLEAPLTPPESLAWPSSASADNETGPPPTTHYSGSADSSAGPPTQFQQALIRTADRVNESLQQRLAGAPRPKAPRAPSPKARPKASLPEPLRKETRRD